MDEELEFKKIDGNIVVNRRRSYHKESFGLDPSHTQDTTKVGNEKKESFYKKNGFSYGWGGDVFFLIFFTFYLFEFLKMRTMREMTSES